jgi:DNA helicase II / ATP-dependent DNA helicase PcrA
MFHADLHIHSKYSRACSRDCDIPHLAAGALRKGISVVGTGDFTHPAWADELKDSLVPAEAGLLRLRPDLERDVRRRVPAACEQPVRFMLSVEISTIYRGAERTRKVHHLIYAPTFEAAGQITASLAKIGNLASDGRPILGLDSRDLLEITLDGGPGCYLVPAHIWTPWFAVLGSRSGFDTVADCYGDLAGEIFAVETGLSSDPRMNWMCSSLDAYQLVSNSDAHSPPMLGREATTFTGAMDFFAIAEALRAGDGLGGTIEFYPEEGKYHLDGHRKCGIRFEPQQTRESDGACPQCHKPLTVGVLHRVAELADRPDGYRPDGAADFNNLVPLAEIISEILSVGPKSKSVNYVIDRLVAAFGPELAILQEVPADDLGVIGGSALTEAMTRLRRGEVIKEAGYDGEYGRVRLFQPGELGHGDALFDLPASSPAAGKNNAAGRGHLAHGAAPPEDDGTLTGPGGPGGAGPSGMLTGPGGAGAGGPGRTAGAGDVAPRLDRSDDRLQAGTADGTLLGGLDEEQRAAAQAGGPLMVIAGPGTGKTRTLTHRIAWQITEGGIPPYRFLALTFTRRAAGEMQHRLAALLRRGGSGPAADVLVTTFHGLALRLLGEYREKADLPPGFRVADEAARLEAAANVAGSERDGRRLIAALGTGHRLDDGTLAGDRAALRAELAARGLADVDELIGRAARLLRDEPAVTAALRDRWPWISVDEYQDLDEDQHVLLRQLAGEGAGLTVIGDPDQAIYGFRGADVGFFLRFGEDYPAARTTFLTRNYRSGPSIVRAALQAIAPATLVPGRRLDAVSRPRAAPGVQQGSSGATMPPGPPGPAIVFHEAASEQAEGSWIAGEIDRLIGGSSFHSLDTGRVDARQRHAALSLSDIAVLYRTDAQAAPLVQALTRAGLPFQKRSHDRLSRRPGVRDIVREIRLAEPVTSDDAGTAAGGQEVSRRLRAAVRRLTALMPGSAPSAVDILAAGEVLAPLASRCGDDAELFLTEISLGGEADAIDPRADAVSLLTLHAAKGLEFGVVFIAGCERGLLPLWRPGAIPAPRPGQPEGPATDMAEERRLLFVGMTRARARLFLTCAGHRGRVGPGEPRGGRAAAGPSPFLADIDPALLSRAASPRRPQPDRQLRLL